MMKILQCAGLLLTFYYSFSQAGTPDPGFGTGGKAFTSFYYDYGSGPEFYGQDFIRALTVQPDGKVIAAGKTYSGVHFGFGLVRYNTDGTQDNSFGTDGRVTTIFGTSNGNDDQAYAVAIQADGKIVAAGLSDDGPSPTTDFAIVRYKANGEHDSTFGTNGIVYTGFGGDNNIARCVAIHTDGKIVAAGFTSDPSGNWKFGVARYNTDGSLDNSFDGDGKVVTALSTFNDELYAMAIQADGKIVVAGSTGVSFIPSITLFRYNTDGSPDNSFDGDGKVTTVIASNASAARAIVIQPDGKIVVSGYARGSASNDFFVGRYNIDGSPDNSFDGDGKVITPIGTLEDYSFAVGLQTDGKIVAAGQKRDISNPPFSDFAIVRYNTDGSLDNTFNGNGKLVIDMGGPGEEGVEGMVITHNRIYVGGEGLAYGLGGYYPFEIAAVRTGIPPLPLTLMNFSAALVDRTVELKWKTASEQNTSKFIVERSNDGIHFTAIGTINASGNSATERTYSFTDKQFVNGTNYYQLRMIDIDAKYTYSKIVAVKTDELVRSFLFFPNPANQYLYVQTKNGTGKVTITDINGRIIKSMQINGANSFTIDIHELAKGTYFLSYRYDNKSEVRPFVKN